MREEVIENNFNNLFRLILLCNRFLLRCNTFF